MPEAEVRVTGSASNWLAVATPGATIVTTTNVAARTDLRRVFELWLISRLLSSWTGRCTATRRSGCGERSHVEAPRIESSRVTRRVLVSPDDCEGCDETHRTDEHEDEGADEEVHGDSLGEGELK